MEAIATAAQIRNVVNSKELPNTTPFEMVFGRKPNWDHMRVFECICYAHKPKELRKKLDDSGIKCRFLGYAGDQKAYRLMSLTDNKIFTARSVRFDEEKPKKLIKENHEHCKGACFTRNLAMYAKVYIHFN